MRTKKLQEQVITMVKATKGFKPKILPKFKKKCFFIVSTNAKGTGVLGPFTKENAKREYRTCVGFEMEMKRSFDVMLVKCEHQAMCSYPKGEASVE